VSAVQATSATGRATSSELVEIVPMIAISVGLGLDDVHD
jgi:hypothetical protein